MSRKGGYQILDLSGVSIVSGEDTPPTGQLKAGTFDNLKLSDKPILVSGMVIDGQAFSDSYATVRRSTASNIYITYMFGIAAIVSISIASDDSIIAVVND